MITEFERRLADVLGTRLPAPFSGRVNVPPAALPGDGPVILAAVTHTRASGGNFARHRPEIVPGAHDPRRVLRLACDISIQIRAGNGQGRPQQMLGLEALLYELDAPEFRTGQALANGAPADPGFLIQSLQIRESFSAITPSADELVTLQLTSEGWFWPVGVAGETGVVIGEIRLRGVVVPLTVVASRAQLTAGGPLLELTLRVSGGTSGTFALPGNPALPFGSLAVKLQGPGARPARGTLVGGVEGLLLAPLTDDEAVVQYQPPDEAATDELVISLDNGEGGAGVEIARYTLTVK
jgi:hypothetical protein